MTTSLLDISARRRIRDPRGRQCGGDAGHSFCDFSEAHDRPHPWKDEWKRER